MTETSRTTTTWICPICADTIEVTMWWENAAPPSVLVVRKVDDVNARVHMEWHRLCTCHWHPADDGETIERHQAPDCEMHP